MFDDFLNQSQFTRCFGKKRCANGSLPGVCDNKRAVAWKNGPSQICSAVAVVSLAVGLVGCVVNAVAPQSTSLDGFLVIAVFYGILGSIHSRRQVRIADASFGGDFTLTSRSPSGLRDHAHFTFKSYQNDRTRRRVQT